MRRIARFLRRPPGERLLLVQALVWVTLVRLGLTLLPFRKLQRLLAPLLRPRRAPIPHAAQQAPFISYAVKRSARYVPRATCLTQALAAQLMLARRGLPSRLQIGVARSSAGEFSAHAWLLWDDQVITGG